MEAFGGGLILTGCAALYVAIAFWTGRALARAAPERPSVPNAIAWWERERNGVMQYLVLQRDGWLRVFTHPGSRGPIVPYAPASLDEIDRLAVRQGFERCVE